MKYNVKEIREVSDEQKGKVISGIQVIFTDGSDVLLYYRIPRPTFDQLTPQGVIAVDLSLASQRMESEGGTYKEGEVEATTDGYKLEKYVEDLIRKLLADQAASGTQ